MAVGKAADELNVTHAAVSQQIRSLENWVGVPLVRRAGRSLALTETGHIYAAELRESFEQMVSATQALKRRDSKRPVKITLTTSFASRWLMPRLHGFRSVHPDISIQFEPETRVVDLLQSDYDFAIRYGAGRWPRLKSTRLANGALIPVCSPLYLKNAPPLEKAEDLLNQQLLHEHEVEEWTQWLRHKKVDDFDLSGKTSLLVGHLAHQAALQGEGIFLSALSLVEDDLREGRLVLPLGLREDRSAGYYLVTREDVALRPIAKILHDWILTQAEVDQETTNIDIDDASVDIEAG